MKETNGNHLPRAREDGLVVQDLDGEVLVYDLERHKAHCLNETAAFVWKHCDGGTTVTEMTQLLHKEFKTPADDSLVWLAVGGLEKAHLLQKGITRPASAAAASRRDVLKKLGWAAAVALPLVTSIIAPTAVSAATGCNLPGFPGCIDEKCCDASNKGTPCSGGTPLGHECAKQHCDGGVGGCS